MRNLFIILLVLLFVAAPNAYCQKKGKTAAAPAPSGDAAFNSGEVVEAQEITIQVDPELPTVVVTPNRQPPEMNMSTLKVPVKDFIYDTAKPVKPSLVKMSLKEIDKPRTIYNRPRPQPTR